MADRTEELQTALTAAKAAGGNVVQLGYGDYEVSGNLGLSSAVGVVLRGMGPGATRIIDTRADSGFSAETYFGLLSFVSSPFCGVEDLSLVGSCSAFDGTMTPFLNRKATFFRDSSDCHVKNVIVSSFRDEGIYADGDSARWRVTKNKVVSTNSNNINLNSSGAQSQDCIVEGNICDATDARGSCVMVGGESVLVRGNILRLGKAAQPQGQGILVVDVSSKAIVEGNLIQASDISAASVGMLKMFGTPNPNAVVSVQGNVFSGVVGGWTVENGGGGIHLIGMSGTVQIVGNLIDDCDIAPVAAGQSLRGIYVEGSGTGIVVVGENTFRNRSGKSLNVGIGIKADVPAGAITIRSTNTFINVATPVKYNY